MAEENAKFLKKIGSGQIVATPAPTATPLQNPTQVITNNALLSPRTVHRQQLEKLMHQQQKQKEELSKLYHPDKAGHGVARVESMPVSREDFFRQRGINNQAVSRRTNRRKDSEKVLIVLILGSGPGASSSFT